MNLYLQTAKRIEDAASTGNWIGCLFDCYFGPGEFPRVLRPTAAPALKILEEQSQHTDGPTAVLRDPSPTFRLRGSGSFSL
jgi:hypothetical protein